MSKKNINSVLQRRANEVKLYRLLMKVVPIAMGCATVAMVTLYTVTALYTKTGAFTVSVNKFDSVKYALTLSETADFYEPMSRLNADATQEITNISGADLPADLDRIDGEHNGLNYMAYTFYCKNAGKEEVTYEYELYIANMTANIDKAVRVRLYIDGEPTDYARTRTDGTGAEPGTVEFLSATTIARGQIEGFAVGEVTKYTIVIWLEGDDPECMDEILGGEFKIDMSLSIVGIEE